METIFFVAFNMKGNTKEKTCHKDRRSLISVLLVTLFGEDLIEL